MPYGTCKKCGCTDTNACYHPKSKSCWWIDDDHELCSHCVLYPNDPKVTKPVRENTTGNSTQL